jgi:ornithine cyclodeaminase
VTLLLSASDLSALLDVPSCVTALREGFLAAPQPIGAQRVRTDLPGPGTATALIPGLIDGVPAYTVKVNAKFPASRPALRGVVCLHDAGSGELLAVLDSATVTAWRTGLAAALATDVLARPSATSVAVIGAGAQAGLVLRGLAALRPPGPLTVFDLDPGRARSLDARAAARDADIVVLATWSRAPLLSESDVPAGAHVTSLGADEPGKAELSAGLLKSARLIVDDTSLAVTSGALGTAGLPASAAAGTFADVLRGAVPGRTSDEEVTVYTPVGLPWQDLALAWAAYRQAQAAGAGREFDFLA